MRIVFGCDPNAAELKKNLVKMCQELAQMDIALDSDSKGRWFESSRAYHSPPKAHGFWRLSFAAIDKYGCPMV